MSAREASPRVTRTESRQLELYDTIGSGYRQFRRPDPRIRAAIARALGGVASVVNVRAGSYEPGGPRVVAVEPALAAGFGRLHADLESGEWERRYGALRAKEQLDLGYRLVVAEAA